MLQIETALHDLNTLGNGEVCISLVCLLSSQQSQLETIYRPVLTLLGSASNAQSIMWTWTVESLSILRSYSSWMHREASESLNLTLSAAASRATCTSSHGIDCMRMLPDQPSDDVTCVRHTFDSRWHSRLPIDCLTRRFGKTQLKALFQRAYINSTRSALRCTTYEGVPGTAINTTPWINKR